jgi:hypothetical protein
MRFYKENLMVAFKHIDRILNQNSYHQQIILYRNYPEVKIEKTVQEEDQNKRFGGFKNLGRSNLAREIKEGTFLLLNQIKYLIFLGKFLKI